MDLPSFADMLKQSCPNADGFMADDSGITVVEKNPLQQPEVDAINAYMQGLTEQTEASKISDRETLESARESVRKAINFGMELIAEFSALNSLNNLSVEDTASLVQQLIPIQMLLLSGSLYTALNAIENYPPDSIVTADIIAEFSGKIRTYPWHQLICPCLGHLGEVEPKQIQVGKFAVLGLSARFSASLTSPKMYIGFPIFVQMSSRVS